MSNPAARPDCPPEVSVVRQLGEGGFGAVYLVWLAHENRAEAMKVLHGTARGEEVERIRREARLLGQIGRHPYIVAVHTAGETPTGRPYILMEYAEGGSLASLIKERGHLDVDEVVRIGVKLAGGLETAHRHGILHRDLKPENILLSSSGEPLLADFGIARRAGETLTSSGVVHATLGYAAPEVLSGFAATAASDVYSLAATMYHLVTGRPPIQAVPGEPAAAMIGRVLHEAPPPLDGGACGLWEVLEAALEKHPADRPRSAAELGEALQGLQEEAGNPVTRMVIDSPQPVAATHQGDPAVSGMNRTPSAVTTTAPHARISRGVSGEAVKTRGRRTHRIAGGLRTAVLVATWIAAAVAGALIVELRESPTPEALTPTVTTATTTDTATTTTPPPAAYVSAAQTRLAPATLTSSDLPPDWAVATPQARAGIGMWYDACNMRFPSSGLEVSVDNSADGPHRSFLLQSIGRFPPADTPVGRAFGSDSVMAHARGVLASCPDWPSPWRSDARIRGKVVEGPPLGDDTVWLELRPDLEPSPDVPDVVLLAFVRVGDDVEMVLLATDGSQDTGFFTPLVTVLSERLVALDADPSW